MPRGQYERKTSALALPKVSGIVSMSMFTALPWWDKLSQQEQSSVFAESQSLAQSMLLQGQARLRVGEHLSALQGILTPHNLFVRFLRTFRFSQKTAYRYIAGYKNAAARLPQSVLTAAMARGINIIGDTEEKPLGVYTKAAEALPPPKEANEVQATTWLDQIEQVRKQNRSDDRAGITLVVGNPDALKREVVRFAANRFEKLPTNKKTREKWAREVLSLLMTKFGVSVPQTYSPMPVPSDYEVQRGRPKVNAA